MGIVKLLFATTALIQIIHSQCPWERDNQWVVLLSSCLCSYHYRELSVQCTAVQLQRILLALQKYGGYRDIKLKVINSTVGVLKKSELSNLSNLFSLQLSGCRIRAIAPNAFAGLEHYLTSLSLQNNELTEVPIESLRPLKLLGYLDLSQNQINKIPSKAFSTLTLLNTLILSDNNVTLDPNCFNGLESSLKELRLKGTKQKQIPEAIRGFRTLKILDLSENSIRELPNKDGLAICCLTSLHLQSNLISDFPVNTTRALRELLFLDIGYNLLTDVPLNAFEENRWLFSLSLDGNPLSTIPYGAISRLNGTLRMFSLGGRFLNCDCRLSWLINWIRHGQLKVSSREKNPQFCGSPPQFRDKNFFSIAPKELTCSTDALGVVKNPITVEDAFVQDNSVVIKWNSEDANILGFRVVYRLFDDKSFRRGPPLGARERELKIKNVPFQKCMMVCVVSLEDDNVTPESMPSSQCRELMTGTSISFIIDVISAIVCGKIIILVIIFVIVSRRQSKKIRELEQQLKLNSGIQIGEPVNSYSMTSPSGALSSMTTIGTLHNTKV